MNENASTLIDSVFDEADARLEVLFKVSCRRVEYIDKFVSENCSELGLDALGDC